MAATNVSQLSLSGFIVEGTAFTYDRLAEDVLTYLYHEFKVEKRLIPLPRFAENTYKHPLAIHYVARQSRLDEIVYRGLWYGFFKKGNIAVALKNDVTQLYKFITNHVHYYRDNFTSVQSKCTPAIQFHMSFAFVVEMTLFFLLNKNKNIIKKMAQLWVSFFKNNLKEDFEADGGLSKVMRKSSRTSFMDTFITSFVATHCIPYTGETVHDMFVEKLNHEKAKHRSARKLDKKMEELKNLVSLGFSNEPATLENASDDDESELDPEWDLKIHERLGLVPHEEVLKKVADVKPPPPRKAPPAGTDASTAKAIAARSLQAERTKAMKLLEERGSLSVSKSALHHRQEKQPAANVGASGAEATEQPEDLPCDRVPPTQLEQHQEVSTNLKSPTKSSRDESLQKEASPADIDASTVKSVAARSLQAERKKPMKLLEERGSFTVAKLALHHRKEIQPAANAGASAVEAIEEPEARPCDRVPPIQLEQYQEPSTYLYTPTKSSRDDSPQKEVSPADTDASTAKAIAALTLRAERKKTMKLIKERGTFSVIKSVWQQRKEKQHAANVNASGVKVIEKPEPRPCDRVPFIQHEEYQLPSTDLESPTKSSREYSLQKEASPVDTDASTAKYIAARSLQAERKKAMKILEERGTFSVTKSTWQQSKEKDHDANVSASGVKATEKPEARPFDRVPSIQHEEYQLPSTDLESPTKSSIEATIVDYSTQGATPKIRKSSQNQ